MTWIKNTGQYHAGVAYVSPNARESGPYKGAGPVQIFFRDSAWCWRYCPEYDEYDFDDPRCESWRKYEAKHDQEPPAALRESWQPGTLHATAGSGEIIVEHGTAAATAIDGEPK